ncbi:amidohydrolase family protein [Shimia sagamensis]|uniref:Amidohydrolase n=1 Tax=Shimia sagamensis TaxID=1566352 RepID=A0ABY1PFI0_9RHOB|nr:amidohydrolase family protein [Shimia sagamensis]SMP33314.1 Amidohydrolase [Shimia sagamensis]
MSDRHIINCHLHLFTLDNVPEDFPSPIVGKLRNKPRLISFLAKMLKGVAPQIERLARMADVGRLESQEKVLQRVLPHYPDDTQFVILPMDIAPGGYSEAPVGLREQHDLLAQLCRTGKYAERLIPFAALHPAREGAFDEFRRCVEEHGFRGLKLYPKLGYYPYHPVLMDKVYPYCVDNNLPVMTHCSRGGVYGKNAAGVWGEDLGAPHRYIPVMAQFPELRICLAHFGGSDEWEDYVAGIDPLDPDARIVNWVTMIRDMIKSPEYPNLFTDISYTMFDFEENLPYLDIFLKNDALRSRVLFGSDYYMTKQEDLSERAVSMRMRHALGDELYYQIAHDNVRHWLTGEAV